MGIVTTLEGKCRKCYSCVRNCPVKAVTVEGGQARVNDERCISCGTCTRFCGQKAKQVEDGVAMVRPLVRSAALARAGGRLTSGAPLIACLAPSFVAAFPTLRPGQVVQGLRELGFHRVCEVSVGARLVAEEYGRLLGAGGAGPTLIGTACPAVVNLVEKYYPPLVRCLAPVVSPMVALGRDLRRRFGRVSYIIFIGPCIAKKDEITHSSVRGVVDVVLTFEELQKLWEERGVNPWLLPDAPFDEVDTSRASAFPISGGLAWSVGRGQGLLEEDVLVVEGWVNCLAILDDLVAGRLRPRLVDLLYCRGCVDGPGLPQESSLFSRIRLVRQYVLAKGYGKELTTEGQPPPTNLRRSFRARPVRYVQPSEYELHAILRQMGKAEPADELNCGACGYSSCREKAVAIYNRVAEEEMCLPELLRRLAEATDDIVKSHALLSRLFEVSTTTESTASMEHVLQVILEGMAQSLGFDAACLLWLERKKGVLREALRFSKDPADRRPPVIIPLDLPGSTTVQAIFGSSYFVRSGAEGRKGAAEPEVKFFGPAYLILPLTGRRDLRCYEERSCGVANCSVRAAEGARCWEVRAARKGRAAGAELGERLRKCVSCPVFNVFGAIAAESRHPERVIDQSQVLAAMTFAGYAGLAIERVHLFEQIKGLNEQLRRRADAAVEELKGARAQLSMAEKLAAIGQLAAEVAHGVKTPVAVISTLAQSFLERHPPGESVSWVTREEREKMVLIKEAADRVAVILADLLSLARRKKASFRPICVNSLVEDCLGFMASPLAGAGVRVNRQLGAGLPDVPADADMLDQVFMNVLNNAIDAMPRGGDLTVRTFLDKSGEFVAVEFADTGCGMSEQELVQVFEPFFTTKQTGASSGLGLAISYDIIERHRGRIEVKSKPGRGTVVRILLPTQAAVGELDEEGSLSGRGGET